jgi:hypothetical protein
MADFSASYFTTPGVSSYVQNPSEAAYLAPSQVTNVTYTNVRYWQRVYSSGLNAWCYYSTLNTVNPTPLSSETTPNWTGSISNFQVVQAVIEP